MSFPTLLRRAPLPLQSLLGKDTILCRGCHQIWSLDHPPALGESVPLPTVPWVRAGPCLFHCLRDFSYRPKPACFPEWIPFCFILAWLKKTFLLPSLPSLFLPFPSLPCAALPCPTLILPSSPMGGVCVGEQWLLVMLPGMGGIGQGVPGLAGSCLPLPRLSWPT